MGPQRQLDRHCCGRKKWDWAADKRPDPEIARDVVAEVKSWLPDAWQHVRPVVRDGWVTLEGEVEWDYQRDYAERAVHWIGGINGISNLILLHPRAAAAEIRHEIEEAFRRNALIDADRVTVEASGGEVILRGTPCVLGQSGRTPNALLGRHTRRHQS